MRGPSLTNCVGDDKLLFHELCFLLAWNCTCFSCKKVRSVGV